MPSSKKKKIVIIGGGFAGVYTAMALERAMHQPAELDLMLVSQENSFLFTPLLHEIVSGGQRGIDICNPLPKLLSKTTFIHSRVERVDLRKKLVFFDSAENRTRELGYDHLVLAVGLAPSFFHIPGLEQKALTMKSLSDARRIHHRLVACLEQAAKEKDAIQRESLLTFVVAGGGFTGVEAVGAIDDFLREVLVRYPSIGRQEIRIVLVHSNDVLAPEMKRSLGIYIHRKFAQRRIDVRLGVKVSGVLDEKVLLSSGDSLFSHTLIWTAGNTTNPLAESLPLNKKQGRIIVNPYLEVNEFPGVWAAGDCAYIPDGAGGSYPPTAQHAVREANILARNIIASVTGKPKTQFSYRMLGQLANIGHQTGVATILGIEIRGMLAWLLWRDIYLAKLPGWEKKIRVWLNWVLQIFFKKE